MRIARQKRYLWFVTADHSIAESVIISVIYTAAERYQEEYFKIKSSCLHGHETIKRSYTYRSGTNVARSISNLSKVQTGLPESATQSDAKSTVTFGGHNREIARSLDKRIKRANKRGTTPNSNDKVLADVRGMSFDFRSRFYSLPRTTECPSRKRNTIDVFLKENRSVVEEYNAPITVNESP